MRQMERVATAPTAPEEAPGDRSPSTPPVDRASTGSSAAKRHTSARRPQAGRKFFQTLLPLAVLSVLATLFVLWEVVLRRYLPPMSIGWHHALLTLWAGVVTAATCTGVYLVMHRRQLQLVDTAERLSRLLESYKADELVPRSFDNPHLVHCRDLLNCKRVQCPMYSAPGERCWQIVALGGGARGDDAPQVELQQCHDCEVYRMSCPDTLSELGESFNNLMFLLGEEARQVGRMRAQMVEKEKMVAIGQMASGIAHEIGNPLSSISSIVQMVKRGGANPAVEEQLELIQAHIQRISATVRQLATLARPGAEHWELTDIGQTLEAAVQLVAFDRRARTVEISVDISKALPKTFTLRDQLQQVFINLALNALDAMENGGKLSISARKNHRFVTVRVGDTGIGIAADIGRRIFEPFFTTKQPGQGTGLGLSVSYGIIQKHGGNIEFDSMVGKGTTFTVRIPIMDKAPDS